MQLLQCIKVTLEEKSLDYSLSSKEIACRLLTASNSVLYLTAS